MAYEHISDQKLATLWHEITQAHFLHHLSTAETLATLERRREIVTRLLKQEATQAPLPDEAAQLMLRHFSILLRTEQAWLERSLSMVHKQVHCQDKQ